MRSVLATIALMIGCIVGGYAWSALRAVSASEELEAVMDAEVQANSSRQFVASLTPHTAQNLQSDATEAGTPVAAHAGQAGAVEVAGATAALPDQFAARGSRPPGHLHGVAWPRRWRCVPRFPPRRRPRTCAYRRVFRKLKPAGKKACSAMRPSGSLHLGTATSESPLSADLRSVCLEVSNHSVDDTLVVRVIVDYVFPEAPSGELTAAAPTAHAL